MNVSQFDATLTFDFDKIGCTEKPRYARFIKRELAKSGKLWAVQNGGEIIWANARVLSINESTALAGENSIRLAVTFELIDGYWVYAWKTRTFLAPYCPPRFINFDDSYCYMYEDGVCDITGGDRCVPCYEVEPEVNSDGDYKPLCTWSRSDLTEHLGSRCPSQFHIRYSCDLERDFFCYDAPWGNKYKLYNCDPVNSTTINFCSMTDLPTNMIQIRLRGYFTDPTITVNGETMKISGTYPTGTTIVVGFGTGVSVWKNSQQYPLRWEYDSSILNKVSITNIPYFEINPGKNTIVITGNKQDEPSFAYIKPVEITF